MLADKAKMLSDPLRLDLLYHQVQQDVVGGYLPVGEDVAAHLAAIQLSVKGESAKTINKDTLGHYLSRRHAAAYPPATWAAKIFAKAGGNTPADDLKVQYLQIASHAPRFGEVSFRVLHKDTKVELSLGLSQKGVAIYSSPFAEEPEKSWSYDAIQNWASTRDSIVVTTGNLMKPVRVGFSLRPHAALDSPVTIAEVFRVYEERHKKGH